MEFAFIDESGDCGAKGTKSLALGLMVTSDKKRIVKLVVKTKQRLLMSKSSRKWLNKNGGELKYYGFPDKHILEYFLKELAKFKIRLYVMIIDKNNKDIDETEKGYILTDLFFHVVEFGQNIKPKRIVADGGFLSFQDKKKVSRFLLHKYQKTTLDEPQKGEKIEIAISLINEEEYIKLKSDTSKMILEVESKDSKLFEELQAIDVVIGCIRDDYEKNSKTHIELLKSDQLKAILQVVKKK